jgi:signal transduction histidine kinase/ActR/RegA family two-component response regulator
VTFHPILARQLKKCGIVEDGPISAAQLQELLARIDRTYRDAETDRYTLERSFEISSSEMQASFEERRRMETERVALLAAKEAADQASQHKAMLLANVSHEMRTPLNALLGVVEILRGTDLDDEQRGLLKIAQTGGDALVTAIGDILDTAKIESSGLEMTLAPFAPAQVVTDTVALLGNHARECGLTLTCDVDDEVAPRLLGDAGRFRQVVLNLTSNALKFTERGGSVAVRLRVPEHDEEGAALELSVTDTGIGIGADDQARLFKRFSQVDGSSRRRYGGTGLGLSICKRIVEAHRGAITVTSTPGVGSTFRALLRFAWPDDATAAPAPAPDAARSAGPLRLLVAEDNAINRMVILRLLGQLGYTATAVEDGAQAVRELARAPFDVVLMDIQMPVMDGLEAMRVIRARPSARQPRIIAVTANASAADAAACAAAGADAFVTKPVSLAALERALAPALHATDARA